MSATIHFIMVTKSNASLSLATAAAAAAALAVTSIAYLQWKRHSETANKDDGGKLGGSPHDETTAATPRAAAASSEEDISSIDAPFTEIQLDHGPQRRLLTRNNVTIVHASMTGTTRRMAEQLLRDLMESNDKSRRDIQLVAAADESLDWWDELLNTNESGDDDDDATAATPSANSQSDPAWLILLLPTYTNGTWPPCALSLETALQELVSDWRIAKHPLKHKLQIAAFGMGSTAYDDAVIGKPAKQAVRFLTKLGAKCPVRLSIGDDATGNHAQDAFEEWSRQVVEHVLVGRETGAAANGGALGQKPKSALAVVAEAANEEAVDDEADDGDEYKEDEGYESDDDDQEPEIVDMEDMGDAVMASSKDGTATAASSELPEMVTPSQAKALKKEGYQLIGTHSAVKLCRWTKHQLRGRGGCYKHTFYGITSYQCMEATPSLACANKCVFCWRHHKNPVGKEWKWKTDDPKFIVQEAVDKHVQLIRQAKGIPGVRMDRWRDALTPKHCALSLVGEPIMYPHINGLLEELHSRQISTFLVTNGQHPHAIESLRPITQLYVSVDAPTQASLVEIDRPLFSDAWDRLKQSLSCLKSKGQRTVARLTVVKGWNSDEISGYAELIALGKVSLVEVKGVTFCGKSDASNLNMTNTPWHHEVVELTKTLRDELAKLKEAGVDVPEYGLACEHKHSCSVLLARADHFLKKDPVTGADKWYTWIDYEKFQALAARNADDPSFLFSVEDYIAETPAWALFGAQEEGFDPTELRHRKVNKHPMYTHFDEEGIPTHDSNNAELADDVRRKLKDAMLERMKVMGSGSTVTELRGGEKQIMDVSLMYRGLVVTKQ